MILIRKQEVLLENIQLKLVNILMKLSMQLMKQTIIKIMLKIYLSKKYIDDHEEKNANIALCNLIIKIEKRIKKNTTDGRKREVFDI